MGLRDYVAQTAAGLGGSAERYLAREGFKVFRAARVFPGYIFIEGIEAWRSAAVVNRTRGVLKLLPRHLETPLPLPFGFVADLRWRLAEGDLSERAEDDFLRRWLEGDQVVALTGPFRDKRGRFLGYTKDCAVVLGYLLGREIRYMVPLDELRAAAV
jgi:transcription antitermination factor NusG